MRCCKICVVCSKINFIINIINFTKIRIFYFYNNKYTFIHTNTKFTAKNTTFIKINKSHGGSKCSPSFIYRVVVKTAMNNGINQQRKAGCRSWVWTRKALNPFGTKKLVFQVKLIFSDLRTTFKILPMAELFMGHRSCTGRLLYSSDDLPKLLQKMDMFICLMQLSCK